MPTSCVPKHYCGTHAPGWLSGSHPTRVGQVVNAKVCFHWGGSCCNWNANIQIKRCNGFYVYKLARTPVCWLRYCGNAGFGKFHSNLKICFLINYRSSNYRTTSNLFKIISFFSLSKTGNLIILKGYIKYIYFFC